MATVTQSVTCILLLQLLDYCNTQHMYAANTLEEMAHDTVPEVVVRISMYMHMQGIWDAPGWYIGHMFIVGEPTHTSTVHVLLYL